MISEQTLNTLKHQLLGLCRLTLDRWTWKRWKPSPISVDDLPMKKCRFPMASHGYVSLLLGNNHLSKAMEILAAACGSSI